MRSSQGFCPGAFWLFYGTTSLMLPFYEQDIARAVDVNPRRHVRPAGQAAMMA